MPPARAVYSAEAGLSFFHTHARRIIVIDKLSVDVMNPRGELQKVDSRPAPRLGSLRGKTIGMQGQHDHEEGEPGQEHRVRVQDDELPARPQHAAPVGRGRLGAEAQEGQLRCRQDLRAHVEAKRHDHGRDELRHDVADEARVE